MGYLFLFYRTYTLGKHENAYILYFPAVFDILDFGKILCSHKLFNCLWYCDLNQNNSSTFSCLIRFWHLAGWSYKSSWNRQITLSAAYFLALEWIEILWSAMRSRVMYYLLLDGNCFRCFYWSVTYETFGPLQILAHYRFIFHGPVGPLAFFLLLSSVIRFNSSLWFWPIAVCFWFCLWIGNCHATFDFHRSSFSKVLMVLLYMSIYCVCRCILQDVSNVLWLNFISDTNISFRLFLKWQLNQYLFLK